MENNFAALQLKGIVGIIAGFLIVALGYNLDYRWLVFAGLFLLGAGAFARGRAHIAETRFLVAEARHAEQKIGVKAWLWASAECYIGGAQMFLGAAAFVGTSIEMFSGAMSSGFIWNGVTTNVSALVIYAAIAAFFIFTGLAFVLAGALTPSVGLKGFLQNLTEVAQGGVFALFGFALLGVLVFALAS